MFKDLTDRLLKGKDDSTLVQMFRYLMVAVVAFAVDFGLLFSLTHYGGVYYLISAAIAFSAGLAVNYSLSIRWVFSQRAMEDWRKELAIFGAVGVVGLLLNELIIWACTEKVGLHYLVSKLISTGTVFFFNFGLRKVLLFSKRPPT